LLANIRDSNLHPLESPTDNHQGHPTLDSRRSGFARKRASTFPFSVRLLFSHGTVLLVSDESIHTVSLRSKRFFLPFQASQGDGGNPGASEDEHCKLQGKRIDSITWSCRLIEALRTWLRIATHRRLPRC